MQKTKSPNTKTSAGSFTPMIRQFLSVKEKHPACILFFRMGDFYETFFDDARTASHILQIVLTARDAGNGKKVPMAGIPHHAAENYVAKLIRAGHKVAICEQMEDPKLAKGLVKREVVRVITPGTVLESPYLPDKGNNYLLSFFPTDKKIGFAFLDSSTGEFKVSECVGSDFLTELDRISPSECLLPESVAEEKEWKDNIKGKVSSISPYPDWSFSPDTAGKVLKEHFGVYSLDGLGLKNLNLGVGAAGALLNYVKEMEKSDLRHITDIKVYLSSEYMFLDEDTQRNLELLKTLRGEEGKGTLLAILDETLTPMGGRLLKQWILHPLVEASSIKGRIEVVEVFFKNTTLLKNVREKLRDIYDLERIISRLDSNLVKGKDLVSLRQSLEVIPQLKKLLGENSTKFPPLLKNINSNLDEVREVRELIEQAIVPDPPYLLKEGGVIREGYSKELDELKKASRGGKQWIAELQSKERERTGIKSLRVGYNKVFGYYIEVTKPNLSLVPDDYIRKQTLVNAERFLTPELKDKEALILNAEERSKELEYEIFLKVREEILQYLERIKTTAQAVAILDVLSNLALVALKNNYCPPQISPEDKIVIKEGRPPVLEKVLEEPFVPNDTSLDNKDSQLLIITGPNMAGKSTYIRQVALIVLLAQIGSFVPAKEASIGVVDRLFTRVGATDDLSRGRSTFMVEMNETAQILRNATPRSLIILDEVGRGTSTYDGMSIAWAVAEFIHDNPQISCKTLFATHYHELTGLVDFLPRAKNYNVGVKEWGDQITFIRKILPGAQDKSYGIHVAKLAGLPDKVIQRANHILKSLQREKFISRGKGRGKKVEEGGGQLTFYTPRKSPLVDEMKNMKVEKLTPLEALNKLNELVEKAKEQ